MAKTESTGRQSLRRTLAFTFVWVVITALSVLGASRIRLDVNPMRLLPQKLPEVQGLSAYLEHFSRPDELIICLDGEHSVDVEKAAGSLADRLRSRPDLAGSVIDRPPGEDDPEAMAELVAYLLLNQEPGQLAKFAAKLEPMASRERISATIETMTFDLSPAAALLGAYDPFGLVSAAFGEGAGPGSADLGGVKFGSADGKLRLIYVWPSKPLERSDYTSLIAWTGQVRQLVREWQAENANAKSVRVRLSGEPAIMGEVSGSMQSDLAGSGFSTSLFIAAMFWGVYRQLRPLLALLAMITLVVLVTFGLSGLLIPELNVMNIGFASILIGLTDYGILIYQQALVAPGNAKAIRQATQTGILCAAATTAASFASLTASSQPSLAKLGAIVAIGVLVGATVMLTVFLPWATRLTRSAAPAPASPPRWLFLGIRSSLIPSGLLALALPLAGFVLWKNGFPGVDTSDAAVRPRISEGYAALDDMTKALAGDGAAGSLIIHGQSGAGLRDTLHILEQRLNQELKSGVLRSFFVPTSFLPDGEHQQENLKAVGRLLPQEARLASELDDAGFGPESAGLLHSVFQRWRTWTLAETPVEINSSGVRWLLQRLSRPGGDGSVWAAVNYVATPSANLASLQSRQVLLADWAQTMRAVREQAPRELGLILGMLGLGVIVLLGLTFRRVHEILWVILSMSISALLALGWMSLMQWRWDFFNAAAILLCLGGGTDYSIHMLLALRRGDPLDEILRDTGRGVLVCALTSVAGFASLAWASNSGLASLGKVCALVLGINCLVATFLLPRLWTFAHRRYSPRP